MLCAYLIACGVRLARLKDDSWPRGLLTRPISSTVIPSGGCASWNETSRRKGDWGFVCFRTSFGDNDAWKTFKELLVDATKTGLLKVKYSDRIRKRWSIQWIEDRDLENASLETLCLYFKTLCSASHGSSEQTQEMISNPGIRRDAFLYADSSCIGSVPQISAYSSSPAKRGFVLAADAAHTVEKLQTYHHGFTGSLRVGLPHIFTTFWARLIPRGDLNGNQAKQVAELQSWDMAYFKARYDCNKIYPPKSIRNRMRWDR